MINEEKYRQMIELSPVPMAIHVMGKVALVNQAACNLIGAKSPKDIIGTSVLQYVHPDSQPAVKRRIDLLIKGTRKRTEVLEEKLIRLDGAVIDVEIVSLLIDYDGKPSIQIILQDITDKKRYQQELLKTKEDAERERRRLYDLFMETPAMIALTKGQNHIFELANPLYLKATGKTPDIIGKTVTEVFPELNGQGVLEILDNVYQTGEPFRGTEMLIKLDANNDGIPEDHYFNFVYQASRGMNDNVDGIMVHATNVTAQVVARKQIEERQQQYRSIFDATHDAILIFNTSGKLIEVNPSATTMHGYTHHEIIRLSALDLIYPEDKGIATKILRAAKNGKMFRGKGRHIKKDKTPITVEIIATPINYKGEPHVMAVVRDITDRQRSEEELSYSNYILQMVTDNASLGLIMMDDRQHCTFMNAAAEKITGYTFAEIQALSVPLHDIVHHSHPDGTAYPMSECPIDSALPQKNRQTGEDIFVRPDGTFYPVRFTASPLIKNQKAVGTIIEVEDLTEILKTKKAYIEATSRRQELEAITNTLTEQRLQLLALNQSKDEFISLASHQLRTPATGVKQYVAMALDGYGGEIPSAARTLLERAYENNERQLTIVNDLLKVAQIDAGKVQLQKEPFDLVDLVASILRDDASKFTERDQHITFTYNQSEMQITADKNRLRMVIENIIDNASKYTPLGKSIKVQLRLSKTKVSIAIKDTGVGIEQEDIDKIFDKFVRIDNPLSTRVGGTGLGLYWAERIVALHDGKITVQSEIEEGSTFTITLPLPEQSN